MIGFKSFADTFELTFQRGITVIVGPNGCGKSNVAEAVRWVLGSQSPSELRVDRMEEVIFSGSQERKPLGMAEVTLELDNQDRTLPVDFDQVSITRRLFRSGDSEYLINGNKCRLMDVTDLIVDEGLGSNGYWILERAMVETILSSRPEDRRFLFDQAAGITRYKIQRHRAELKLEATGRDLERIEDIVSEVESTVSALKKQVNAFRRYENAARKINEIRGVLSSRRMEVLSKRLEELDSATAELKKKEDDLRAAAASAKSRLSAERTRLEKVQAELDRAHTECSRLEREIAETQRELAVCRERMSTTEAQLKELGEASRKARQRSGEMAAEARELQAARSGKVEELSKARSVASELGDEMERQRSRRDQLRKKLDLARRALQASRGREEELESSYRRELVRRQEKAAEAVRLELERESLRSEIAELDPRLKKEKKKSRDLAKQLREAEGEVKEARAREEETLRKVESAESEANALQARAEVLRSRISSLRESQVSANGSSLSTAMKVGPGLSKAVGAYLDAFQDATLTDRVSPEESKGEGVRLALAREEGQAPPDLPEGARWLPDCVDSSIPGASGTLSRGVLAPDRVAALRWFMDRLDLDIVTPEGDLFRADGLVRLGVPSRAAGTMEREGLLADAKEALDELQADLDEARRDHGRAREDLKAARSELDGALSRARELEKRLAELSGVMESLRSRSGHLRGRLEELEKADQGKESGTEIDMENLEAQIVELKKSQEGQSTEVVEKRGELDDLGTLLEELSERKRESDLTVGRLEADLAMLDDAAVRLDKESKEFLRSAEASEEKSEKLNEELEGLKAGRREYEKSSAELEEQRQEAERKRIDLGKSRGEVLQSIAELESGHSEVAEEMSETRERRTELAGEASLLRSKLEEMDEAELVLPEAGSRYYDLTEEKLQRELERQTGYRERLGPVNMLAVEEYEEAKERLGFLSEQREDLLGARASLLEAIDEINRTAAIRFEQTFEDVRGHFQQLFLRLFGGGEADIMAVDAEDPLESGVRIMASPRGKTLKNVSALSDGERALTAVALLFALYLVKPSPFCVLDELDSPLDDSNIDRFIDLLRSFMERTQFVVITHNKRTMEAADILYGITMQESGVSTATTVKLEEVEA
jgi:chromosome segregation protein